MSIHQFAGPAAFGGGHSFQGSAEAGQARRGGHGHQVSGHGHGRSRAAETEESEFSFHAHFRGAMGEDGPGKSGQSPAFQVAFYLNANFESGEGGLESFENFGQAVSQFLQGLLTLTAETDTDTADLPPADDGETGGEVPDSAAATTDGEPAAIVAPGEDGEGESAAIVAPGEDGERESEVAASEGEDTPVEAVPAEDGTTAGATSDGDGDSGIIVPAANVDGSAEAELLDALFDDGDGEDEAAA